MTGPRNKGLTARQAEVLAHIRNCIASGSPPTRGDIAQHFGFSHNAAETHVQALANRGVIELHPGRSRNITLTGQCPGIFDDRNLFDQFARVVFLMHCNQRKIY